MGARRCFGNQPEDCCHFYDPGNSNKCLTECSPDRMVTDTFDCAGVYIGFACTSMRLSILTEKFKCYSLCMAFCRS